MNRKSVDKSVDEPKKPVAGKGSVTYWQARVRKTGSNQFYSVPIQHSSRRMEMSLGSANIYEAAAAAKERYLFLVANGWDAFLAKYRPDKPRAALQSIPASQLTVGLFLDAVRSQTELEPKTIDGYAVCLRRIVADIFGIDGGKGRFGYRGPKYQKWLDKVHTVRLEEITPERMKAWRKTYIDRAGKDEALRRRYALNANSYLRRARALFSRRNVLDHLKVLPPVLPFAGIQIERVTTKFYGLSGIDPRALLRDALAELESEPLKAFILSLTIGLRRREADLLEWSSIDLANGTLQIVPTEYFKPKTHESLGVLPIEPEFLPVFRGWKAKATGPFVIETKRKPKAPGYQWYRCQEVFDSLLTWLRKKGITTHKPFHTLRKLYGSALADLHGIHAASSGLRHTDIRTTAEFYADARARLTAGFGSVLSGAAAIVPLPKPDASQKQAQPNG